MANQHTKLPYNTTSGAVPSAYSAENDYGIKAGELAVNLYQGQEFLVTRNENGDIVKFSSDNLALFEKGSGANSIQQKGTSCTASGDNSFAMGYQSSATTFYAHAEGSTTLASGGFSHAEGSRTTADGTLSHAEGDSTTASGSTSHAEGYYTLASGGFSHAEGSRTTASGDNSHTEGNYTIANNSNEHASGRYNKSHISGATEWDDLQGATTSTDTVESFTGTSTLFSVGFGNTSFRRNALEVTKQGQTLLNSRKTYFRYADASADMGDQSYAATGATQYQTTPGVAEYITMFDVIEKVRGNDNYAVFEKGSGANSAKQVGGNLQTISPNEVALGKNNTSLSGVNNFTIFSIGNGEDDSITGRSNVFEIRQTNQPYGDNSTRIDKAIFKNCQISYTSSSHETKTISSTTGASSLSGITSGLGVSDGTKMIFINNSGATGNGVVYISSANTMVDGQKITLYFTNPQQIRTIDTNYDGITIYGHYNGNVETFLVGKASMAMNFKTSIIEIIKLGDNSFIVEFRNTTSGISGL